MTQPPNEWGGREESQEFPVARLPGETPAEQGDESGSTRSGSPAQPSWLNYGTPMRGAENTHDPNLHPRYWEAQIEAARRGSLAWGFVAFFLGYGGYYLLAFVLGGALSAHVSGFDPANPPELGPLLLLAFAPNVLLGLVPALYSWRRGNGLRSDFGIVPKLRDVKVGLACGGVALLTSWLLGLVLISVSGPPPPTAGVAGLVQGEQSLWLFLFALFAFLGAPFTEELLMRGALWGALEHYRIPRYAILLLTALFFAFMHQEAWRMPILFAGGLAMGFARMLTGRVSASMIAHATNNFLPALLLFFMAG